MQNEILPPHAVYVSLSKLIDELFAPTSIYSYPCDLRFYWLVYELGRYSNAFSSPRTKTNPGNYLSWYFSETSKGFCRETGKDDQLRVPFLRRHTENDHQSAKPSKTYAHR